MSKPIGTDEMLDRIEELEARMSEKLTHCMCGCIYEEPECPHCNKLTDKARIVELEKRSASLEAKLAKAVGLLEAWINVATHCTIEEGVCCCGDNMDTHANPMDCGHSPVDHGAYVAMGLVEKTNTTLAELTGGQKDG